MGDLRQLVAGGFANKNAAVKDPQTPGTALPSSPPAAGASDGNATPAGVAGPGGGDGGAGRGGGGLKVGDSGEKGASGGGGAPPAAVPAPANGSAAAFSDKQQQQQQRGPKTTQVRLAGWRRGGTRGNGLAVFVSFCASGEMVSPVLVLVLVIVLASPRCRQARKHQANFLSE